MNICYRYLYEQAQKTPDKSAIVCGADRVGYKELLDLADRAASGFSELGIEVGSRLAIVSHNTLDFVIALFAAWKLGACAVPINYRESAVAMAQMLKIADAKAVLCADRCFYRLEEALSLAGLHPKVISETPSGLSADMQTMLTKEAACFDSSPEDGEAIYIFTSGTMGIPKAAVHSSKALAEFSLRCIEHGELYLKDDVFLSYSPLCHIGGIRILLGNLMCGATLVLSSSFESEVVSDTIIREGVTNMFVIPPSLITRLKDIPPEKRGMLQSVRRIRVSGGMCYESALNTIFELFPQAKIISGYGSSESMASFFNVFDRESYEKDHTVAASVGFPLVGNEVLLLGEDGEIINEPHKTGRLFGSCEYMFTKYREADGDVMRSDPCYTGDIFYFDAHGRWFFKGRMRDIIKTGGENVFASEVETALMKMPEIAECAVFGLPNDVLGEAIAAAIVLKDGSMLNGEEIIRFCRADIAGYKKPVRIYFVKELPKTSTGKVRKQVLCDMAQNGKLVSEKIC